MRIRYDIAACITAAGAVSFSPASFAQDDDFELFFGLMHSHSGLSDGVGTPDEAYDMARAEGVDFFALTEHNHDQVNSIDGPLNPTNYAELRRIADAKTVDGSFVAIAGQEVSSISSGNHVNVFETTSIVDIANGDFRDLFERYLPAHPEVPFIQFNHPDILKDQRASTAAKKRNNDYGIDDYNQSYRQLVAAAGNYVALMEMIVGPAFNQDTAKQHRDGEHQTDYLFYLNEGFRIAPSVGQDNHHANWGSSTHARMGVWAEALTKQGIYDAINQRRAYASEDENIAVTFKAGSAWMGSTVRVAPNSTTRLSVSIADPDEPDAEYTIALFSDDKIGGDTARIVDVVSMTGNQADVAFDVLSQAGSYHFIRIAQRSDAEFDEDNIWTAPIWFAPENDGDPGEEHSETGIISWEDASDFVGQTITVEGRIVDSFLNGQALFLNFNTNFNETLTLVIFANSFDAFGGAEAMEAATVGKMVRATGEISTFRGRPQMVLNSPDQLVESSTSP